MSSSRPSLVFTDLDASLLNEDDYAWDGATEAIEMLRQHKIPLVLASSKTASEMRRLADEIGTNAPLICENGGSIGWLDGTSSAVEVDRTTILESLDQMRGEGFAFRSFRDLGATGIAEVTGLPIDRAELALDRHATEPLLFDGDDKSYQRFAERLSELGLTVIRGGRFFHVAGPIDKSFAMTRVIDFYTSQGWETPITLAIGDSPNDLRMLQQADYAIVIPGTDGKPKIDPEHSRVIVANAHGCQGWGAAVLQWLRATDDISTT